MRKKVSIVAVLGLLAAAGACGEDHKESRTTAAPATAVAATTTTASPTDLAPLLLDASDVGEGWNASTELSIADLGSIGESPCPGTAINPTIAQRLKPTVGVQFEPADGSKRGIQEVVLSGNTERLAADLDIVFGGVDVCKDVETTTPDAEKLRYEPLAVPELGDQRMAAIVTVFEPPDFQVTWRGHTAIVRYRSIAIMLNQFEILPSPQDKPVMSDAEFVELLRKAVTKLSRS
jgi:hypothetical protein